MNLAALLTKREYQIAELLAWGSAKKEIPDLLPVKPGKKRISVATVEVVAKSVYRKTGVQKAAELTVVWFCDHFNISMDLSPTKRRYITIALLLISLSSEFSQLNSFLRPAISAKVAKATLKIRLNRKDDTYNLELI